ncbi:MAG: glycosyltransferase family 2 protein [Bacteroidales bacterium]|jgi:glycosyltransferase involved in cell wall biosynthesis|nr:glycosyltransferase family 2 protein [Bacteroidales bacterium]
MTILAIIVIVFTIIQLLVSLTNLLYKRTLPASPETYGELISVLIPARNEIKNIGNLLIDLVSQDHRNIEVIVFDDQSEDNTAAIVKQLAMSDKRIKLISSEGLPHGWHGKNHACNALSEHARGEYFMFIDADVRIGDRLLDNAVRFSQKHGVSLISIFPKQIIKSIGEMMTVPNMNYILVSLLPLVLVRKSDFPSLSAANGQFMFFRASEYRKHKPHRVMKAQKAEDIAIARYYKKNGYKIACLLGDNKITCRMYSGFHDAVNGFSKNVIAFFGNSFLLAILFWAITTFGILPVYISFPELTIFYITAYIFTRVFVSAASRQNLIFNLLFILPLQVSMGLFIYKAFINKHFRKFQWKGRYID